MSDLAGDNVEAVPQSPRYVREFDPECFLEIITDESNRERRSAFFRRDVDVDVPLRHLVVTASSLNEKDAIEASQHSSRLRALKALAKNEEHDERPYLPEISHLNLRFETEITSTADFVFGLISENGPSDFEGRVSIEIRMGPEDHSDISHYEGDSILDRGSIFICVYLSQQRLQWLHSERLARPHLVPVLSVTVNAFKQHSEWSVGRIKKIYLEPNSSAQIVRTSLHISDANPLKQVPEELLNGLRVREYKRWISDLKKRRVEGGGKEEWGRCAEIYYDVGNSVLQWCAANNIDTQGTNYHLNLAEEFLEKLDETIHDEVYTSNKRRNIWQHVYDFKRFVQDLNPVHRDEFAEDGRFYELLDEYIRSPSLRSDHLDWLMLDLLLTMHCVGVYQAYMKLAHGFGFVLFGGVRWKMFLWKLFVRPVSFLIGWVLPAVGFYYLAQQSEWVGIGLAALYYGAAIWMLLYVIWSRIVAHLNSMPNQKRVLFNRLNQIDTIYRLLAASTIHLETFRRAFDNAQDAGANFDHRLFFVLEREHARTPQMWRTGFRGGYGQYLDYNDRI
jgi:hypothetical protein